MHTVYMDRWVNRDLACNLILAFDSVQLANTAQDWIGLRVHTHTSKHKLITYSSLRANRKNRLLWAPFSFVSFIRRFLCSLYTNVQQLRVVFHRVGETISLVLPSGRKMMPPKLERTRRGRWRSHKDQWCKRRKWPSRRRPTGCSLTLLAPPARYRSSFVGKVQNSLCRKRAFDDGVRKKRK